MNSIAELNKILFESQFHIEIIANGTQDLPTIMVLSEIGLFDDGTLLLNASYIGKEDFPKTFKQLEKGSDEWISFFPDPIEGNRAPSANLHTYRISGIDISCISIAP